MNATTATGSGTPRVLADALPSAMVRWGSAIPVALGVTAMAVLAQVSIHVAGSPVPITGQTLGVVVCGATLGARRGTLTMALYLAAGLVLPIYAAGAKGPGVIASANGGYLVGFVVAAFAIGWLAEHGADRRPVLAFASFSCGQLIIFAFGVPWLKVAAGLSWSAAIHDGFTIFILGGAIKAAVSAVILSGTWRLVR